MTRWFAICLLSAACGPAFATTLSAHDAQLIERMFMRPNSSYFVHRMAIGDGRESVEVILELSRGEKDRCTYRLTAIDAEDPGADGVAGVSQGHVPCSNIVSAVRREVEALSPGPRARERPELGGGLMAESGRRKAEAQAASLPDAAASACGRWGNFAAFARWPTALMHSPGGGTPARKVVQGERVLVGCTIRGGFVPVLEGRATVGWIALDHLTVGFDG